MVFGGETSRVLGAKRLGWKIEAKRLGGKRLGGKRLGGEMNDMPEGIDSSLRLFVDDSLLYRIIRTQDDQTIILEDLRKLEKWEHK